MRKEDIAIILHEADAYSEWTLIDNEPQDAQDNYRKQAKSVLRFILTPEEAKELLICLGNESMRRYGKVNKTAPLYVKLQNLSMEILE